jgi:hypothetical protein
MIVCWWCALGDHDRCDGEAAPGRACTCACNETMGELVMAALDLRGRIEGER